MVIKWKIKNCNEHVIKWENDKRLNFNNLTESKQMFVPMSFSLLTDKFNTNFPQKLVFFMFLNPIWLLIGLWLVVIIILYCHKSFNILPYGKTEKAKSAGKIKV